MSDRHLRFRPDIEGLRAIAIMLVVLYHAGWSRMPSGFLGVDVFFVLSGFLITGLLLDEIDATGRVSLTSFWARRARRLLPAAAVITLVVLVANALLLDPFEQENVANVARANSVYASNILFTVRSTDYFGVAAARDPLLHSWSLSVEEQFYLFFAPAMIVMALWVRKLGAESARRRFVVAASLVTVVSFLGCLLLVARYPLIAFYALPARMWEFGVGALCVVAAQRARSIAPAALELTALAGMAAVIGAPLLLHPSLGPALGVRTLLPTLGTAAILLAGAGAHRTFVGRALSLPPVRLLGRLSYSWYLWHWPSIVFLNAVRPNASVRLTIVVAVLALIPAALTYRFVESPIRFSRALQTRRRLVLAGAVASAMFTAGAATLASWRAGTVQRTPRYAPLLAAEALPRIYDDGCQASFFAEQSPTCRFGPGRNDTTIVVFGDSHAGQWFPAFDSLATLRGWTLENLTKNACPSVTVTVRNASLQRRYDECDRWRERAIKRIVAERPTIVVLSNVHTYTLFADEQEVRSDFSAAGLHAWGAGLLRTLTALAPSGAKLIVLQDTPLAPFHVPRCLNRFVDTPTRCRFATKAAVDTLIASIERASAREVPGVSYESMNAFVCEPAQCNTSVNGLVRFRDTNHLTVQYAQSLTPFLARTMTYALAK